MPLMMRVTGSCLQFMPNSIKREKLENHWQATLRRPPSSIWGTPSRTHLAKVGPEQQRTSPQGTKHTKPSNQQVIHHETEHLQRIAIMKVPSESDVIFEVPAREYEANTIRFCGSFMRVFMGVLCYYDPTLACPKMTNTIKPSRNGRGDLWMTLEWTRSQDRYGERKRVALAERGWERACGKEVSSGRDWGRLRAGGHGIVLRLWDYWDAWTTAGVRRGLNDVEVKEDWAGVLPGRACQCGNDAGCFSRRTDVLQYEERDRNSEGKIREKKRLEHDKKISWLNQHDRHSLQRRDKKKIREVANAGSLSLSNLTRIQRDIPISSLIYILKWVTRALTAIVSWDSAFGDIASVTQSDGVSKDIKHTNGWRKMITCLENVYDGVKRWNEC
ncbi:hypothetical protein F5888DRAFT_1635257 [Russula emetica]|nr:hypothetical protein F5888DRAFT_1635257 [Russula emetica]